LTLLHNGVLSEPTLTVSPWFEARRSEYYDTLLGVSTKGDWDSFLSFFAKGLAASARATCRQMLALVEVQEHLKERIRESNLRSSHALELVDFAVANDWANKFNPNAISLATYDGNLAGYPTSYNILGVYYRKDIFGKYGIAVPTTFDEFEAACATLKENGVTPISTAGLYGWHVMRFVELLIEHYAGAELHDKMNLFEESYNNEAVIQALTKYKEFVDKGYFPIGFITANPNDTRMAVYTGDAAMDIQGQWYDGMIIQDEQPMEQFGVFAFPSGEKNRLSAFVEMTEFNAKNTPEELEACVRFMDFYYSQENVDRYAAYFNQPLPLIDPVMPKDQPNVPVLLKLGEENGTFTITDQAFPTEVADALFNVQAGIANNEMTPEEGAAKIQEAIEAYLNK